MYFWLLCVEQVDVTPPPPPSPPQGVTEFKYKCVSCVHIDPKANKLRNTLGWVSLWALQLPFPNRWILSLLWIWDTVSSSFLACSRNTVLRVPSASRVGMRLPGGTPPSGLLHSRLSGRGVSSTWGTCRAGLNLDCSDLTGRPADCCCINPVKW